MSGKEGNEKDGNNRLTLKTYLLGVLVILASSYSQYLVPGVGFVGGAFLVYGISIIVIGSFYGKPILRNAFRKPKTALKLGLGFFGIFTVVATAASFLIIFLLAGVDPAALRALHKPVPVLHIPPGLAWVMVWASLIVVGPCEEFIFRGFVFGGLLTLFGTRHWLLLAFLSSLLFAAVHLYYALTYGIASMIPFLDIMAIGMALAMTYYYSGGNLLIPALIHGVFDATGFMGVAVSTQVGSQLRGMLMLVGLLAAAMMLFNRYRGRVWRF